MARSWETKHEATAGRSIPKANSLFASKMAIQKKTRISTTEAEVATSAPDAQILEFATSVAAKPAMAGLVCYGGVWF